MLIFRGTNTAFSIQEIPSIYDLPRPGGNPYLSVNGFEFIFYFNPHTMLAYGVDDSGVVSDLPTDTVARLILKAFNNRLEIRHLGVNPGGVAIRLYGGAAYLTGANFDLLIPEPVWSGSTSYVVGNKVCRSGKRYVCIAPSTNNAPPNATYWKQHEDWYLIRIKSYGVAPDWSDAVTYDTGSIVAHDGMRWRAKVSVGNLNQTPSTSSTFWELHRPHDSKALCMYAYNMGWPGYELAVTDSDGAPRGYDVPFSNATSTVTAFTASASQQAQVNIGASASTARALIQCIAAFDGPRDDDTFLRVLANKGAPSFEAIMSLNPIFASSTNSAIPETTGPVILGTQVPASPIMVGTDGDGAVPFIQSNDTAIMPNPRWENPASPVGQVAAPPLYNFGGHDHYTKGLPEYLSKDAPLSFDSCVAFWDFEENTPEATGFTDRKSGLVLLPATATKYAGSGGTEYRVPLTTAYHVMPEGTGLWSATSRAKWFGVGRGEDESSDDRHSGFIIEPVDGLLPRPLRLWEDGEMTMVAWLDATSYTLECIAGVWLEGVGETADAELGLGRSYVLFANYGYLSPWRGGPDYHGDISPTGGWSPDTGRNEGWNAAESPPVLPAGKRKVCVAMSYDTSGTIRMYIDGKLTPGYRNPFTQPSPGWFEAYNSPFKIGFSSNNSNGADHANYFHGRMYGLALYKKALSAGEIASLSIGGASVGCPAIITGEPNPEFRKMRVPFVANTTVTAEWAALATGRTRVASLTIHAAADNAADIEIRTPGQTALWPAGFTASFGPIDLEQVEVKGTAGDKLFLTGNV